MIYAFDKRNYVKNFTKFHKISNFKGVLAIVAQWAIIFTSIAVSIKFNSLPVYFVAALIIGSRQHALGILMHEAAHRNLVSNRFFNDLLSDLFCAFPIGISTTGYRKMHLRHHANTNTPADPDYYSAHLDPGFRWPKNKFQVLGQFFMDMFGLSFFSIPLLAFKWSFAPSAFKLNGIKMSKYFRLDTKIATAIYGEKTDEIRNIRLIEKISLAIFLVLLVGTITTFGLWHMFLLYWIIPFCTGLPFVNRVRYVSEHQGTENSSPLTQTRTVSNPAPLEKFLFAPCNVNFHLEHHLFPGIPFYNLPLVHRDLMIDSAYSAQACIVKTYLGRNGSIDKNTITASKPTDRLSPNQRVASLLSK